RSLRIWRRGSSRPDASAPLHVAFAGRAAPRRRLPYPRLGCDRPHTVRKRVPHACRGACASATVGARSGHTALCVSVARACDAGRVPVRRWYGATREALTLDRRYVGFIPANGDAATLEWRLTPGEAVLRIFLADRVGVIAIDDFTLLAGEREVWRRGAPGAIL